VTEIIEPRVIRRTNRKKEPARTASGPKGIPSLEALSFRPADYSRNKKPTIATIRPLRKSGRHTTVTGTLLSPDTSA
jgi:hypothetical protein